MQSKQIIIAVSALFLIGLSAFLLLPKDKKEVKKESVINLVSPTPTPTPVKLLTWTDSDAGFSFQYPEDSTVDKHPEDNENYANLTLSSPSGEKINIIMADNKYKDLDRWAGDNPGVDTTLDGRPAKKIIEGEVETVACIDNEVIVTISGKDVSKILDSWTFIYPEKKTVKSAPAAAPVDSGDVLVEE